MAYKTLKSSIDGTKEAGYAVLAVLVLMTLSIVVVGGSLDLTTSTTRTTFATKQRSVVFYESEGSIGMAVSWLRENSDTLLNAFRKESFYSNFDLSTPSNGVNNGDVFSLPTKVKLSGEQSSIILANSNDLAGSNFPTVKNVDNGEVVDIDSLFSSADLGESLVKITLIDAVPYNEGKDYGPPPNPDPETDFYPVFRIDAMTDTDRGSHLFAYVEGQLKYNTSVGFYGDEFAEVRQDCDSYESDISKYNPGTKRANCSIGSNKDLRIQQTEKIYGSVQTNKKDGILETSPWGGEVCSNFKSGCTDQGTACDGDSCDVPGLPIFEDWSKLCPFDQGDLDITSDTKLSVLADAPDKKCWSTVTVAAKVTLTLDTTTVEYFIKTINLKNNSVLNIAPDTADGRVVLNVEKIYGDKINGSQAINATNRPGQFVLNYLGTDELTLNGNADMNASLVAPYAAVTVSGDFDFFGGIVAKSFTATGSGKLHYDETLGETVLTGMRFRMRQLVQYYR